MKKGKKIIARILSLVLAMTMVLGMCMTSAVATEAETETGTENLTVTFVTDGHATVDVYYNKDNYTTADETDVTSAYVRGKGSSEIDNSGDGQVNFKVNADEGYTYEISVTPTDGYNNCKGEDETGVADIWRITKISKDLTVTITTAAESKEGNTDNSGSDDGDEGNSGTGDNTGSGTEDGDDTDTDETSEYYTVTFVTDEHVTVDTYYTKDASKNNTDNPDETNVTSAIARESETGEPDTSGTGQVNFKVNVDDGYEYTVTAEPESNYKTLKGKDDTGVEDVWRVSKMTGNVTVTITSSEKSSVGTEIGEETVWSYLDDGTDPAEGYSDRTAWTLASYDVSAWSTAAGSFGAKNGAIADLGSGYTPDNLLSQYKADGSTDIEAYFFRAVVNIEDASAVTQILGSIIYDDSATVYINGTKIAGFDDDDITENLQYGGSNAGTPKTGDINVTDEDILAALVDGENVIAVEIHQGRASSSDIYFEMPYLIFSTDDAAEEQTDISISMGSDETERNFTWYAPMSGTGYLYVAEYNSAVADGEMPSDAVIYTATGKAAGKTGYYYYQTTVTDLEYETTYVYQLVNGDTKSDVMTFTTGSDGDFSFAFVGDPQIGAGSANSDNEGWANTLDIIANNELFSGVDFMLSAGDQVQTGNDEDLYDLYLNHTELYNLTTATVIGNHDTNATDSTYSEHFNITNASTYGTSSAGSDYYYVYNGVLFLVLNSNNTSTAEHKAFMEEAIAATADQDITWKIVTFHHSIYSVASHAVEQAILTRRDELVPVFEELDIDVVLMGHDHVYCRTYIMDGLTEVTDASEYDDDSYSSITDPDGILYVTANSASGSKYYSIQNYEFTYAAVMNQEQVPNVSRVDITDTSFTITTYRTTDMSVVDTFTINRTAESACESDGHTYGDPTYTWSEDYASCTASFTCSVCGDEQTVECDVTSVTTEATETEDGSIVYTATCMFEGTEYSGNSTVILAAFGSTDDTDGTGNTGDTGSTDGTGDTGSTDGTGDTGSTDGTGNTGDTGSTDGTADTGDTGSTDGTADLGDTGSTDGTADTDDTESTDGTADTGDTGSTDSTADTGDTDSTDSSDASTTTASAASTTTAAKTGDTGMWYLWILLVICGVGGVCAVTVYTRRNAQK